MCKSQLLPDRHSVFMNLQAFNVHKELDNMTMAIVFSIFDLALSELAMNALEATMSSREQRFHCNFRTEPFELE